MASAEKEVEENHIGEGPKKDNTEERLKLL